MPVGITVVSFRRSVSLIDIKSSRSIECSRSVDRHFNGCFLDTLQRGDLGLPQRR